MSVFDAKVAQRLNDVYRSIDVVERRLANFKMLEPAVGECIVDLGCGPGFMSEELARAVGQDGQVIALDPAEPMCEVARDKLAGLPQAQVMSGQADQIPLPASSADAIVAVQVMEYVPDLAAAFTEFRRVLKPGGRIVLGDIHYGSAIWHSHDPDRMARFFKAWHDPVIHPNLVEQLGELLHAHQFIVERQTPLVMLTNRPKADSFPNVMAKMARKPAIKLGLLSETEVDDLFAEQEELAAKGGFFFAMTHYVTRARRA